MDDPRYPVTFELRYAVRVLALESRLFRRVEAVLQAVQMVSGTAAFAAIVSLHAWAALGIGAVLAVSQALAMVLRPGERAVLATVAAVPYRNLLAEAAQRSPDELAAALARIRAADGYMPVEALRARAYNDVAAEMGCAPDHHMPLRRWVRWA